MKAKETSRVIELTEKTLTGSITAEQFAELQEHLRESEKAREVYLEHSTLDPMLRWIYPATLTEEDNVVVGDFKPRRHWSGPLAALAACLVIAVIWMGASMNDHSESTRFVTLENDVRVEIEAGTDYEIGEPFILNSGSATFLVGEKGTGFTVEVPHGRIVDLGTAFSVAVDSVSGAAEVSVLAGEIEVFAGGVGTPLIAGESGRLLAEGWVGEIILPERVASEYDRLIEKADPVARWSFTGKSGAWLADLGTVKLIPGPQGAFAKENTAAFFGGSGSIRVPDRGVQSEFDFAQGDEITLEAWVKLEQPLVRDRNVYVIGKGRTENVGYSSDNQNFSLRLRGQNDAACVSFLFRSPGDSEDEDFHRWTTTAGILPDSWHHIAVSYHYGDPGSVRGYIDGEPLSGEWDMGGATTEPPVVDDDEIWIGSSLGESANNTFPGAIDEVAIYRKQLNPETIAAHAAAKR